MSEDPYCYPGTDCLKNKLKIVDAVELRDVEGRIVAVREVDLSNRFLPGTYNLDHLNRFHRRLFGDVYEWAGTVRTVTITGNTDELEQLLTAVVRRL